MCTLHTRVSYRICFYYSFSKRISPECSPYIMLIFR